MENDAEAGIILLVNGTNVALGPDGVRRALSEPVTYKLARPVNIGTVGAIGDLLINTFDFSASDANVDTAITALPAPLKDIAAKLRNLDLTIEKFELTIDSDVPPPPPAGSTPPATPVAVLSPAQRTTFVMGVSAVWTEDPIMLIPEKLGIRGAYFEITRRKTTTATGTGTGG
jgi:hypothetical protein